jgi:DNA-3-methyladenine glycosylase
MAKKRRFGRVQCGKVKCSRRVAQEPQIPLPTVSSVNSRFTTRQRTCDDERMPRRLGRAFFNRSVHEVAPDLIGVTVLFNGVGGRIVEVEAYHQTDPAAHSFRGPTNRNAVMFGPPGYVYVYRSYGIHWCLNFVCEPKGSASAVLIRALEPTEGLAAMRRRRGVAETRLLCSGPGRLCEALGITVKQNGFALDAAPFELFHRQDEPDIVVGPRIGLTKAVDKPWRYGLNGSRFLSKPFAPAVTSARRMSRKRNSPSVTSA